METSFFKTVPLALLVCLLPFKVSIAKEIPTVNTQVVSETASVQLQYELCGSCDDIVHKSICDFSGDICTELLAPLDLKVSYLGCFEDLSVNQLKEPTIQNIVILTDYLFRGGRQLTCDDIAFLSASQILDGLSVATLTEVISELFERTETTETEN